VLKNQRRAMPVYMGVMEKTGFPIMPDGVVFAGLGQAVLFQPYFFSVSAGAEKLLQN
jgi:hypothetical protein